MSRRGEAVIVVHQMAKVGSRSWVEAAKPPAGRMEAMPLHCHFVMPHNRETIAAAYRDPAKQQTIANMLLPRNMLRSGAAAWAEIEGARARGEVIRVITGIRDPIARSISFAVFMADFYGHTTLPLSPRAPMSADFAIDFLQKNWKAVLDGQTPDSTFEWLLWFVTGAYRTWFDDELLAAHGIDLRATPFERGAGVQHVRGGLAEILAYRAEDMLPSSRGHDGLLQQARAFLGTEITEFPSVNTSHTRRSSALSDELRRRFSLPDDMLDAIYDDATVRHFYSRDEIGEFRRRWGVRKE
jgi:hypothetical protein